MMVILIPINIVIVRKMRALSAENMKHKDKRIKLMNEILNGIKVRNDLCSICLHDTYTGPPTKILPGDWGTEVL